MSNPLLTKEALQYATQRIAEIRAGLSIEPDAVATFDFDEDDFRDEIAEGWEVGRRVGARELQDNIQHALGVVR